LGCLFVLLLGPMSKNSWQGASATSLPSSSSSLSNNNRPNFQQQQPADDADPGAPSSHDEDHSSVKKPQQQQLEQQQQQQPKQPPPHRPQWKAAVAGACAGAFSRTVMAPVERVKLLLQLQGSIMKAPVAATGGSVGVPFAAAAHRPSAWQVARTVYHEQGFWSFWRGNWPNVCRVSGTAAINFTALQYYKPAVEHVCSRHMPERQQHMWTGFVSGGLAGATSTTILYPVEFVRTRLAADMGRNVQERLYTGTLDVLRKIFHSDGVVGFYQGYGIALAGGIVYRVMYLGGYDVLKAEILYLQQRKQRQEREENLMNSNTTTTVTTTTEMTWGQRMACAQMISLTAGTISYPLDSIRRRMMMQAGRPAADRLYRHSWHCFTTVLKQEGVRGFYLGIGPNIFRSLGGALLLVGYDTVRSWL